MQSDRLIVFDMAIPIFRQNRIFDDNFARQFPGATFLVRLKEIAVDLGWDIMTGDVFLEKRPLFQRAVCLSNEATPDLRHIIRRGVELGVLISGESPNVAWSFYHNLPRLSKGFRHACLFRGASDRVHPITKFHPHFWPMPWSPVGDPSSFEGRKLLGMVCSYKERFGYNRKRLASRIVAPYRWAKIFWYQTMDQHARFPDLYRRRLDAVGAFASKDGFSLFGHDWDMAQKYVRKVSKLCFASPPGPCGDKIDTLSSFRFTLVFENCIFPGYLTEKIFDAMLAGTVPVYLGAPDIEDFVPGNCFVDFRDYGRFADLWDDLSSWPEEKWQLSVDAIKTFLQSERYAPFREENVAEKFFGWLTEESEVRF